MVKPQTRKPTPPQVYPKAELACAELSGKDVFTVSGVLSEKEATALIKYAESLGMSHQSSRGPAYGEAFRDNDRVSVEDPAYAQQLWDALGLRRLFVGRDPETGGEPVGLNPNLRFYRYVPGQRFGRHVDESVDLPNGGFTGYTLLLYLSTPRAGGETVFYKRGRRLLAVKPQLGTALLHRHCPDCLEHEGAAVVAGDKWILRSDVVFRR